jgi:bisanhydrobacterioruberin hydratase
LKIVIAILIALIVHVSGLIGMLNHYEWFVKATPFNLLLMLGLVLWTQPEKNRNFWIFACAAFAIGMITEIIGVNTGILFGNYRYGSVLGPGVKGVPLLIGVNWLVLAYCCGVTIHTMASALLRRTVGEGETPARRSFQMVTLIVDSALLATFYDWVMEPVAVKLGFWQWLGNGNIPALNYYCWFGISLLIQSIFHLLPFKKHNLFAVNLLVIQLLFFWALRIFL